ncbi:MAG: hypothetical protein WB663_05315 [Beijerinckiaceae bacterium]|jgi:hypothetical protein
MPAATLIGKWTYRSFLNNPAPTDGDPQKLADLLFAEAVFTFQLPTSGTLKGAIDWQGGGLDLEGTVREDPAGDGASVEIVGTGRAGTGTDGWEYDYNGRLAHTWPNGVNQVPALVGTVIRAKPHNGAPAGVVASFIAVKQP